MWYIGEIFKVRQTATEKKMLNLVLLVDGRIRTNDPETHRLSTTPFVMESEGNSPRLTTCQTLLSNGLPNQKYKSYNSSKMNRR